MRSALVRNWCRPTIRHSGLETRGIISFYFICCEQYYGFVKPTLILCPCNPLHTPLTLSLIDSTGLPLTFLILAPLAFLRCSALISICSFSKFRTQISRCRPLMKCARINGCLFGRGLTCISTAGFAAAKDWRRCCRKDFMPFDEPAQSQ